MSSLDVDPFFTIISLVETITICFKLIYNQNDMQDGFSKLVVKNICLQLRKTILLLSMNNCNCVVAMDLCLKKSYQKHKNIVLMNLNQFFIKHYYYSYQFLLSGKHSKRNSSLVLLPITFFMLKSLIFSYYFCKHC